MLRVFCVVFALQFLSLTSAYACEGQSGLVIFQDKFADDSGGWDLRPPLATIKPPALEFALTKKVTSVAVQNLTFHATIADSCLESSLPKPFAGDILSGIGLEFWATDYNNSMLLQLRGNGSLELYKRTRGKWERIYSVPNAPGFKSEPGAVNAIRINTHHGKLTAYLNGTQVKVVRAQVPRGKMRFGIYSLSHRAAPSLPAMRVTSFKVTTGR